MQIVNHWDKVVMLFMSVVVAGLIGFFSSVILTKEEIGRLKTEMAVLKTEVDKSINPKLRKIEKNSDAISTMKTNLLRREKGMQGITLIKNCALIQDFLQRRTRCD